MLKLFYSPLTIIITSLQKVEIYNIQAVL